ncbi:hypothetical protein QBC99_000001, partial [Beijerinckia sp. GAS462]|uniref:hypothetical protein n=1 Tax=Beijerinckia sp. GAS462 TaxID=3039852 RepID=UPI0024784CA6
PELGRQTLPRQWYYVSRPGRVGRCQACKKRNVLFIMKVRKARQFLVKTKAGGLFRVLELPPAEAE